MNPLVTVIIPAYNNEATLEIALSSIVHQTYKNLEIIVVDDFSTDRTRAIAEEFARKHSRVRVMQSVIDDPHRYDASLRRNINAGWSARNSGLSVASGEFITFQDGDDASFLNRIETQLTLITQVDAMLITTSWVPFDESLLGKEADLSVYQPFVPTLLPWEITRRARRAKGLLPTLLPSLSERISFKYKRMRILNKLFFGTLEPYPGAANNPFFRREVITGALFRPLSQRIWPSFMGRGTDRDFHFQVAERFKNSYFFDIPLYMWRT